MPKPTTPSSRVIPDSHKCLMSLLRTAGGEGLTREDLMNQAKVSPRTMERFVEAVEAEGGSIEKVPCVGRESARLKYVLQREPEWAKAVSMHARLALHIAELAIQRSGTELWHQYLELFEKSWDGLLTEKDAQLFKKVRGQFRVHGTTKRKEPQPPELLLEILEALCAHPRPPVVEMKYLKPESEETETRKVIPFALTHDIFAGSAYLLAWDPSRNQGEPRTFRLSRIKGWKATAKIGTLLPREVETLERIRRHQIGAWSTPDKPFQVQVEVGSKHWIDAFMDTPPDLPEVKVSTPKSGRVVVSFMATELVGPTRWVMQLGKHAKVLEPAGLRAAILAQLQEMAGHYT